MPRRASPGGPTGLAVVDKEAGWTSHDVVARCRRIFGQRRAGHAGTLDPDATGLLLVGLGPFTRALRFLSGLPKRYQGELVLGVSTDTLDASGTVVGRSEVDHLSSQEVRAAAAGLTGSILQVPPMVSAVKVGGRRLHELARAGIEVERRPRPVTVTRFEVEPVPDDTSEGAVYRFDVSCSTGTYVRVLAADLGDALGVGGHIRSLRRTEVGSFQVEEARTLDRLGREHLVTPAQALREMESVTVDADTAAAVSHGLALDGVALGATGPGPWALCSDTGDLLAVYEATGTDRIVASVVLVAAG